MPKPQTRNAPHIPMPAVRGFTARFDKLLRYQAKQSIQEIVLISQYVQHVEVITRTLSGWEYQEYGHEEDFSLASLNVTIRMADIYRRLSIPLEKRTLMPLEIIEPADEQEKFF